ncbi:MAG: RluA family pseudouridine synthase [Lachnospiraceae bacterium]|nr:RluA family pseudouridine synthase [Lachnospiraceae bacterium]
MIKITVSPNDSGQKLFKYLKKDLCSADDGFIRKMLRKKNIVLNSKKADGREELNAGDEITLFFSDETYAKMSRKSRGPDIDEGYSLNIVYEDEEVLIVNKPSGVLSQRDKSGVMSINEYCLDHCLKNGSYDPDKDGNFTPSVCNRLDRNTSGLIIFAKNYRSFRTLSGSIKEGRIEKYYITAVCGCTLDKGILKDWYIKDEALNRALVFAENRAGSKEIETHYEKLSGTEDASLLRVRLITGRTHQIRAHMAYIGHPVIGDPKYGNRAVNEEFRRRYKVKYQLLHSAELRFPEFEGILQGISNKRFLADIPGIYIKIFGEI